MPRVATGGRGAGLSPFVAPVSNRSDPVSKKSKAVMEAMLKMTKIDVPTLERAYRGA
jgi:hypothetical protein